MVVGAKKGRQRSYRGKFDGGPIIKLLRTFIALNTVEAFFTFTQQAIKVNSGLTFAPIA